MKDQLNSITKQAIDDLKDDINMLSGLKSNIEVIWALERLHRDNALLKSADLIRKFLQQDNSKK